MYQAKNQKNTVVMEKGIVDANGNTDLKKRKSASADFNRRRFRNEQRDSF